MLVEDFRNSTHTKKCVEEIKYIEGIDPYIKEQLKNDNVAIVINSKEDAVNQDSCHPSTSYRHRV